MLRQVKDTLSSQDKCKIEEFFASNGLLIEIIRTENYLHFFIQFLGLFVIRGTSALIVTSLIFCLNQWRLRENFFNVQIFVITLKCFLTIPLTFGSLVHNLTEVTSVKLVFCKYVMSFETLTKVDQLTEIVRFVQVLSFSGKLSIYRSLFQESLKVFRSLQKSLEVLSRSY